MLSRFFSIGRRQFSSLNEQEMLALAISSEEDDARIYRAYADGLRTEFPDSAGIFDEMAKEEDQRHSFGFSRVDRDCCNKKQYAQQGSEREERRER